MKLARSVGQNTLLQVIGKAIGTVLGFATVALLQRSLGSAGYGAYTTAMAFMGFFSVIADFGLYLIVLREIAKPNADKERIVGNALSIRIIGAASILVLGIVASFVFPYARDIKMGIAIISVSFFFVAIQQVLTSLFQQALKMRAVVFGELAGRIVLLGGVWILAQRHASLSQFLLAVVFGSLVNMGIVSIAGAKLVRLRLFFDMPYWRFILKESWPIAISIILNLIYFRIDTIFLSIFRSMSEVGLYGAAYKILEILVTFPNMFIGLVMPILSAAAFLDWPRFSRVFKKSFDAIFAAGIPLVVGGMLLARPIIVLVGGPDFAGAAAYFRILLVAVFFLFLGSLSGHTVTAINEQRKMVWRYLAVAVLGVVSYLVLIPPFGAYGAAIGTALTEGSIMLLGYHVIKKKTGVLPSFALLGKIAISCVVMAAAILATRSMHVIISILCGSIGYVGAMLITKAIDWNEVRDILRVDRSTDTYV